MEIHTVAANPETPQSSLDPRINPVCHCVFLKLKTPLDVDKLRRHLRRVRASVPGLVELHFGENDPNMYANKLNNCAGNTHALFSRHQNARYLKLFQTHPMHMELVRFLLAYAEAPVTVVDFVDIPSHL